jgi:hypothetical protein
MFAQVPFARCHIVQERENPTADYYIKPALRAVESGRVFWHGFTDLPDDAALQGATVVFVRYVPRTWRARLQRERKKIARIIFFMDDDLLDAGATTHLPLRYRLKIFRLATLQRKWLLEQGAEFWVSTPYLAEKYATLNPRVLAPQPLQEQVSAPQIFCHATDSHRQELVWLYPVVKGVLNELPQVRFELIGARPIRRLYQDLPQVTVTPPMPWPAFRHFSEIPGRRIGLVPALDTPFNRGRAPTRFLDITRAGAVGIYSSVAPWRTFIRHEQDGILLANDYAQWVKALVDLLADSPRHAHLLSNARQRVHDWPDKQPGDV